MNKSSLIFVIIALILAGIGFYLRQAPQDAGSGTPTIGGHFALTGTDGKTHTEADFAGKYMLVYFGYTYCPDICPTDLMVISKALKLLGDKANDIAPLFITVDPDRDTKDHLTEYMQNFDPRIIALTGPQPAIDEAKSSYKVYSAKVENSGSKDDYLVDHSAFIYLMGRDGKYITHFAQGVDAKSIADKINAL